MRRQAPAAARNRQPILEVLGPRLPSRGIVLEVASGSGEHTAHFAQALPDLTFQPSDPDPSARASIDAWTAALCLSNVLPALDLDAAAAQWPIEVAAAIVCINMIHISPWASTVGLIRGAARLLPKGGTLFLYGPFIRAGVETAPGNLAFDRELQARDPAWGLREVERVVALARECGFPEAFIVEMPANNLSLVLRRA